MAQECRAVIGSIDLVKGRQLDSSMINHLDDARDQLECYNFLTTPSATLAPPLLKILKPENIAEKIKASKPSTSSSRITVEMVRFVEILLDYVQDRVPVPSLVFKKLLHLQAFFILLQTGALSMRKHEGDFFIHVEDDESFLDLISDRIYKSLLIAKVIKIRDYNQDDRNINAPTKRIKFSSITCQVLAIEAAFDETALSFTVADEVKKFYYGLLLLVTYLLDPLVQYSGCKEQNNLLKGFGTIAIEAKSPSLIL
ncbi:hypothetical protein HAX54_022025 [Datura stramonium]|uniref:Uncharacterized protein n=1 Tax=Datura stramonium TaxID=4076 RepID=A0ABS8UV36_DATST|nr:hypothetical protein [Datura stramonium]